MFSSIGNTFFDSIDNVSSFANTNANLSFLITDDDDRTEAEFFTTLDNLGYATDLDYPFLPFRFFLGTSAIVFLTFALTLAFFIAVVIATVAAATVATTTWS
jgi:hypothetical protein